MPTAALDASIVDTLLDAALVTVLDAVLPAAPPPPAVPTVALDAIVHTGTLVDVQQKEKCVKKRP